MKKETAGAISLLGAGLLWGTTGTAQTFAPEGYDPVVIGLLRLSVGGLVLLLMAIGRGGLGQWRSWPLRPTLLGAVTVASFQVCFFSGVHLTGVAVGTIVGLGSAPICAGLLAFLLRGERPGGRWYIATFLAIFGCTLLLFAGNRAQATINPIGLALSGGAGLSYALYAIAVKDLVEHKSAVSVMAVLATLGTLLLLPLLWERDLAWLLQARAVMVALYLGVFSFAAAMILFAHGLSVTPIAVAVTLTLAEPMTAGVLGVFVVGESLPSVAWGGLLMVLSGLVMLTLPVGRKGSAEEQEWT